MDQFQQLREFYAQELKGNILPFWLNRCHGTKYGGYLNCFDNEGNQLVSTDKYTWSQGRFVWVFSKLYSTTSDLFSHEERQRFFDLAEQGAQFLMDNVLIGNGDWRCVFLMDQSGVAKLIEPEAPIDASIYADCFVVAGLSLFSKVSKRSDVYDFARKLYSSIMLRLSSCQFNTWPYPLSQAYRAHGIPMIMDNVSHEFLQATELFAPELVSQIRSNMEFFAMEVINHCVDDRYCLHEVLRRDKAFMDTLLGRHINPGHTLEDLWFIYDAIPSPDIAYAICEIAKATLERGWDHEFGGLFHYCSLEGGKPTGALVQEPMEQQVLAGWDDKLWWVHSEALYTTLLCYSLTYDKAFLHWHEQIRDYTFSTFPNPNRMVGEWIQIRNRNGKPQDKVVALPVKDPYHIIRNLIMMVELLDQMIAI